MYTRLLDPDQISQTQSMVAKRSLTKRANVHTPMWKSTAEFQLIQQFGLQLDNVWGDAHVDQEPTDFFG